MLCCLHLLFFFVVLAVCYDLHGSLDPRAALSASSLSNAMLSVAWYAGWHNTDLPLSAVSWSKYNVMNYAFALTTPNASVVSLEASDQSLLPQFVTAAHDHNVKAGLSIGGWTGSQWFSSNVASAHNRTAFANALSALVEEYDLDGIDFDWEYPASQGIGCNTVNSNDTTNFLSFLQELRLKLGSHVLISAATGIKPFIDVSGNPSSNVSGFGDVLDFIVIMNYDISSSSTPNAGVGPNSPLYDNCAPTQDQDGSAQSAVDAWTNAGMPKDRIVLGVPMYGHSYRVERSAAFSNKSNSSIVAYPSYNTNDKPTGDRWNGDGGVDVCGVYEPPAGTYAFWSLIDDGFLDATGSPESNILYRFDSCSQTPYVYDPSSEIMIAYDNQESFTAKGNFIKSNELRGFAVWEAAGDYNDLLIDAILNGTINGASAAVNTSPQPSSSTPGSKSSSAYQLETSVFVNIVVLGSIFACSWMHIFLSS